MNTPEHQIMRFKGHIQLLNALIIQLVELGPERMEGLSDVERMLSAQRLLGKDTPGRIAFDAAYECFNLIPTALAPK